MSTPRDDWLALDAQTQRAVKDNAFQYLPHPDPRVSAVAARYARDALDGMPRMTLRPSRVFWTLVPACLLASGLVFAATSSNVAWLLLIVALACLLLGPPLNRRRSRARGLWRIEQANLLALGGAEVPCARATATDGAAGRPAIAVRYEPRRIARDTPLLLAALSLSAAYWGAAVGRDGPARAVTLVLAVLFTALTVVAVNQLVRRLVPWVLPGRPVMVLDAAGVHRYARPCLDLPWSEVAEVRLFPMRSAGRGDGPATILAVVPSDPALSDRMLTADQRGGLARVARSFGTPVFFPDQLADHSAEQIAAVASELAGVPVRQY